MSRFRQRTRSSRNHSAKRRTRSALRIEPLEQRKLLAVDVGFLGDINAVVLPSGLGPSNFIEVGSTIYFTTESSGNGSELWKTDGTAAGTSLVIDLRQGSVGSYPTYLTNVGGSLYFSANDGINGKELWTSDGTAAGTVLVRNIRAGSAGSFPKHLTNVDGTLYFAADAELWKSDGTAAGTTMVSNIRAGALGSYPEQLTNVDGTLFFRADDGIHGTELWTSNGTAASTTIVSDIRSGSNSSYPRYLTNVGGTLYFSSDDGTSGRELWKTDVATLTTTMVSNINAGSGNSYPRNLVDFGGVLYFSANDGIHGYEFWTSDGTTAGTTLVSDINPGSSSSSPSNLTNVDGNLFFSASHPTSGTELWTSDGTAAGTSLVIDLHVTTVGSYPTYLTNVGGALYFSADDGVNGTELWTSDGTAAGTTLVEDIRGGSNGSSPQYLTNISGTLFFRAYDEINGTELWTSTGTAAGTNPISDIPAGTFSSSPSNLTNVGGTLYFTANDGTHGTELWSSDGTTAGTMLVSDIFAGSGSSDPSNLTEVAGTLFFTANDGINGIELWSTDGTVAGTAMVSDIRVGGGSAIADLTNVDGTLYFTAQDGVHGVELWTSDGTAAGTKMVSDIRVGSNASSPRYLTNVDGTLFFRANEGSSGYELWVSDGTAAGTSLVSDIRVGTGGSSPAKLINVAGTLYFTANDGISGTEVWTSDGTSAGTTLANDIRFGSVGSYPKYLSDIGGTLYFQANDGSNGVELWASDGTPAGTTMVSDIRVGNAGSFPRNMIEVNGIMYFQANDGTAGSELWSSDGTTVGTTLVSDVYSGSSSSLPSNLSNVGGVLYFNAEDDESGNELWRLDQRSQFPERLTDFLNGSPLINLPIGIDNRLYFVGTNEAYGTELYSPTESDDDDQISEAVPLTLGTTSGEIETLLGGESDVDMYSFSAEADDVFAIDIDSPVGNLDSLLRVFDALGNELDSSDDNAGPSPEYSSDEAYLTFTAPTSGTFYVAVTRSSNLVFDASDGSGDEVQSVSTDDPYELSFEKRSPAALDDVAVTTEDTSTLVSVLANDTPASEVVIVDHEQASNGSVINNGDGTLTYTPNLGFTGTDTFDYTIALRDVELVNPVADSGDRLGYSVDVDGNFAVVGAYLDDPGGLTNAGSAFIYERTGATAWAMVAQLNGDLDPSDAQSNFGFSVAIDGDTVVVGAQYDRDLGFQAGAAYVFDRNEGGLNQWGRVAKLSGNDTVKRDLFGRSVDISGDTIVVGASVADPLGASSGAAYVFDRDNGGTNNWGQTKKLLGSTQSAGDRFGQTASISDDLIAVGAFRHDGVGNDSGAVYVYSRDQGGIDSWGEVKAIEASDAAVADQFGYSVSLDGTSLAIGAPLDDEAGVNQLGSVYVHSQDQGGTGNWGQVTKLTPNDVEAGDRFGTSVALAADRIVAGSPWADDGGNRSGRAYAFENIAGTWTQTRVLTNDEVTTADQYGIAVAVDGDVAVIGSWLDNRPDNNSGGAYAFDLQTDTATVSVTVGPASSEIALRFDVQEDSDDAENSRDVRPETIQQAKAFILADSSKRMSVRETLFTSDFDMSDDETLDDLLLELAVATIDSRLA
ncbi:pre-peptidase C-terminal domain-containing protein [Rubripirellula amarantea]|nr:pre-peptidase C-terminal domain-containing protein [Rubripirellula amarantea]